MSHLQAAVDGIVEAARAVGMRTTDDPRSLNPPILFVSPLSAVRQTVRIVDVEMRATLVAPGAANKDALMHLDNQMDILSPALDAAGLFWQNARLVAFRSPSSGEDLLGYELDITVSVDITNGG